MPLKAWLDELIDHIKIAEEEMVFANHKIPKSCCWLMQRPDFRQHVQERIRISGTLFFKARLCPKTLVLELHEEDVSGVAVNEISHHICATFHFMRSQLANERYMRDRIRGMHEWIELNLPGVRRT